ncbi:MAG: hypothetical protein ABIQ44_07050, partial [Chloroflexia bacterium]
MSQSSDPEFIDQISEIEDLDPEPVRERGIGSRRDLLIGIPLILVVIVFVALSYWRQEYQAGQYHVGQDAMGRSDWETAIRFFAEASGYSDSDMQAKGAQAQIEERDRLYKSAGDFGAKGDWLYALKDIRAAEKIQPGYADLSALEGAAIENVYTDALAGAIVVRDKADPPGLYLRSDDNWVWLDGSDKRSAPLARDGQGHIVYDVPSKVIQTRPPPMPGSLYNSGDLFIGRKLVWAQELNGAIKFHELELDASHFVPFISGADGLWLVHPVDFIPNDHHSEPIIRDPFHVTEMAYQPYTGGAASTVQIPPSTEISDGETIVSIDPGSNKYLLAEWKGADSVGVTTGTTVDLYLCAMGETTRQLIYTHTSGGLQSAQLSPSGRFVVVHTYTRLESGNFEEQSTVLVDLQDSNRTATLVTLTVPRSASSAPLAVMASAFVRQGALKESLVLSMHLPATTHIQLLDPLADSRTVNFLRTDVRIEGSTYKNWEVTGQGVDGALVVGQEANQDNLPVSNTLSIIRLGAAGEQETHNIQVSPFSGLTDAFINANSIRWTNYEYVTAAEMRRPVRSLYSLSGASSDQAVRLFTTNGIEGAYLRPDPS